MPWPASPIECRPDAELGAVGAQGLDLRAADRVVDHQRGGGDVVVLGGEGEVRAAHGAAGQAQAVEGLRAGDLVDEVQVDVDEVRLALGAADDVGVPDLLGERAPHRCHPSM
jgi:hypothetical protein